MAEGYDAPIPQALWRRVTTYGIPTVWFAVWFGAGILQLIFCLARFGLAWGLGIACVVISMQLLIGQWLTRADMQWDELRATQWIRRYKDFYA